MIEPVDKIAKAIRTAYLQHENRTDRPEWEDMEPSTRIKWRKMAEAALDAIEEETS